MPLCETQDLSQAQLMRLLLLRMSREMYSLITSYTATLGPGLISLHRARKELHLRLGEASGDIMDVLCDRAS